MDMGIFTFISGFGYVSQRIWGNLGFVLKNKYSNKACQQTYRSALLLKLKLLILSNKKIFKGGDQYLQ